MDIPKEFFPVLLVQIALFLGLWAVLRRWWFDPAMRVINAREKRSDGAVAESRTLHAEAERLRREHAAAVDQAKAEAGREVQEMLRAAEAEHRRIVGDAHDEAHRTTSEVRELIAREVEKARQDIRKDVETIAREMARTVIGRAV
jgi:F-type H+-transporting ATPase subunit b